MYNLAYVTSLVYNPVIVTNICLS